MKMKLEVDLEIKGGAQQLAFAWIAGRVEAALKGEMEVSGTLLEGFGPVSISRTAFQQPLTIEDAIVQLTPSWHGRSPVEEGGKNDS